MTPWSHIQKGSRESNAHRYMIDAGRSERAEHGARPVEQLVVGGERLERRVGLVVGAPVLPRLGGVAAADGRVGVLGEVLIAGEANAALVLGVVVPRRILRLREEMVFRYLQSLLQRSRNLRPTSRRRSLL